jgi:hypothetical protein
MLASRIIQKLAAFSTSSGRLLTSLLGNVVDDRGDQWKCGTTQKAKHR